MKRKFFAILLVLLLTVQAALADAPVLGGDARLLRTAHQALNSRYGLTNQTIGLFDTEVVQYGDTAIVTYVSNGCIHESLTGEYAVIITPEGVNACWTHDAVDPALWQSGELTSPAWGELQLQAYLAQDSFERAWFSDPYAREACDPESPEAFEAQGGQLIRAYELYDDQAAEAARMEQLAVSAVQVMYDLTDAEAGEIDVLTYDTLLAVYPDGQLEWWLLLYHDAEPDEANYYVVIDGDDDTILDVAISTGGAG